ncbi:MAG: hypothetical protein [Bacteriophage sp.]|nr:MAG: hypothetical protein [Bacteriophage sp.]
MNRRLLKNGDVVFLIGSRITIKELSINYNNLKDKYPLLIKNLDCYTVDGKSNKDSELNELFLCTIENYDLLVRLYGFDKVPKPKEFIS